MNFKKFLSVSLFLVLSGVVLIGNSFAQERDRVIQTEQNRPPASTNQNTENQIFPNAYQKSRPTLITDIVLAPMPKPLVKKTASSRPINAPTANNYANYAGMNYAVKTSYSAAFSSRLLASIQSKMGIPYLYGSSGPNRYDCSGLVWSVFQDAGFYFERTSARSLWYASEPVEGADRFKFGTLVFFKNLGHMGIVADENGFYHASSSKGVTYSRFDGYWAKLLVGFRRMRVEKPVVQ